MGLFDKFRAPKASGHARPTPPAVPNQPVASNQPSQIEMVKAMTDQDALLQIAREDENESVRYTAIPKLNSAEALLGIVLSENSERCREAAAGRYCDLAGAEMFFPTIRKPCDDDRKIARAAAAMQLAPLQEALRGVEDADFLRAVTPPYVMGLIDVKKRALEAKQSAFGARIRELETGKAAGESGGSGPAAPVDRYAGYTPEMIVQDREAPAGRRREALKEVRDQSVLLETALHGPADLQKTAVGMLTDREALERIARETGDLHLAWCAARRSGHTALLQEIEGRAEKHVNGHAVIVTAHREWECHEEMCIRCGGVRRREDDSESTRHYGKRFEDYPCSPDIEPLENV